MTQELARGYWPSYNVAYFPEVYEAAGYPDMVRVRDWCVQSFWILGGGQCKRCWSVNALGWTARCCRRGRRRGTSTSAVTSMHCIPPTTKP